MYQGEVLQGQQVVQPTQNPPASNGGLHFLEGIGQLFLAGAHFFGGEDEEGEEIEKPNRRPRSRFTSSESRSAKPTGSCCRAKRPAKP